MAIDSPQRVTDRGVSLAAAVRIRQRELAAATAAEGPDRLTAATALPGWDRLTLLCHLRYGAEASLRLTEDALGGRPSAYYPGGRDRVRPATLVPRPGETPAEVLASLSDVFARLDRRWSDLGADDWTTTIVEPADQVDLGPIDLAWLALLRLTEVEVHGADLEIGLGRWSDVFIDTALPARLGWLARRRSNHGRVDHAVAGHWRFESDEGMAVIVSLQGDEVVISPVGVGGSTGGDATIGSAKPGSVIMAAPAATLLAFLLGRCGVDELDLDGDRRLADRFHDAFPPP